MNRDNLIELYIKISHGEECKVQKRLLERLELHILKEKPSAEANGISKSII